MQDFSSTAILIAAALLASWDAEAQVPPHPFNFKSYMGRCLDFGPPPQVAGSPVFIYDCNGTIAQRVGVEESPKAGAHRVRLRAGNLCIGVSANPPVEGAALMLQACQDDAGQIFAWDGDSILMDSNLDLSVQLKDGVTKSRTPLVLGGREVSDTELWDARALDVPATRPMAGFVSVSTADELQQALATAVAGTVIVVTADIGFPSLAEPFSVPGRVTIRGERRGVAMGPQISLLGGPDGSGLFYHRGRSRADYGIKTAGSGAQQKHARVEGDK